MPILDKQTEAIVVIRERLCNPDKNWNELNRTMFHEMKYCTNVSLFKSTVLCW